MHEVKCVKTVMQMYRMDATADMPRVSRDTNMDTTCQIDIDILAIESIITDYSWKLIYPFLLRPPALIYYLNSLLISYMFLRRSL